MLVVIGAIAMLLTALVQWQVEALRAGTPLQLREPQGWYGPAAVGPFCLYNQHHRSCSFSKEKLLGRTF